MNIIDIELRRISIPLKNPFITALRRVEYVTALQVRLTCDQGFVGIGEAPPTVAITGEDLDDIQHNILHNIAPLFKLHKSLDKLLLSIQNCCKHHTSAKAAVDMALYDLQAKTTGQPLYRLLGGVYHERHSDITISLQDPQQMLYDAQKAYDQGCHILKVKVGKDDGLDLKRIQNICQALPQAQILVDANQAWTRDQAHAVITALEKSAHHNIALIEQPLKAQDLEGMRALTAMSSIPILADESVFSFEDARYIIQHKIADMINIKLMKCGGISQAVKILNLCRKHQLSCMLGSMLESPYSIATAYHLALAYPDTIRFLDLDSPLLYAQIPEDSPVYFEKNLLKLRDF